MGASFLRSNERSCLKITVCKPDACNKLADFKNKIKKLHFCNEVLVKQHSHCQNTSPISTVDLSCVVVMESGFFALVIS